MSQLDLRVGGQTRVAERFSFSSSGVSSIGFPPTPPPQFLERSYVAQAGLKLLIFLPLSLTYWGCKCELPCPMHRSLTASLGAFQTPGQPHPFSNFPSLLLSLPGFPSHGPLHPLPGPPAPLLSQPFLVRTAVCLTSLKLELSREHPLVQLPACIPCPGPTLCWPFLQSSDPQCLRN